MCRLFGYRNSFSEPVFKPLLDEDNALLVQSREHRDGWGLAYFHEGFPHVFKSKACAAEDEDFMNLARNLKAELVIGHLRRATQGKISLLNSHPFQYGRWVMAHNGDLPEFCQVRDALREGIAPEILRFVFGNTDSEIYFALFLNEMLKAGALSTLSPSITDCADALHRAVSRIEFIYERRENKKPFALNVLVSDGTLLLGYRQGHGLFFSAQVSPSDEEGGIEPMAAADLAGTRVSRLTICSEPHSKNAVFLELKERQMIGLDQEFRLHLSL